MPVLELVGKVEKQTLDTMKSAQKTVLEVVDNVLDNVGQYLPEWPADRVPRPGELLDKAFGFAEKMLAQQHEFSGQITDRLRKASEKDVKPAKPAARVSKAAAAE